MGAQVLGQGEEIALGFLVVAVVLHLPQAWIGDFSQRVAYRTSFEAAGVEDRGDDLVVDGLGIGRNGLVQHAHGTVGRSFVIA